MQEFIPENELEQTLVDAQAGRLSAAELMAACRQSDVVLLLNKPVDESGVLGSAQPLAYRMRNGEFGVAVFSVMSRAPHDNEDYQYALQTKFSWIISIMAPGAGIVMNPGHTCGFELPSSGVKRLKAEIPATE